jgi:hypothetical protein
MGIAYNPRTITDGLVLCLDAANTKSYPTTGTTWTDLSGSGNTGTLTNGPTYSSANGGSISFDGTNDYVTIPDSPSWDVNNGGYSICFWMYPKTIPVTSQRLIASWASGGYATTPWMLSFGTDRRIHYDAGNGGGWGLGLSSSVSSVFLVLNTWNYINVIINPTTTSLYVNLQNVNSKSSIASIPGQLVTIGRWGWDSLSSSYFNGNIAQVSIYNRALTAAEIQQNYNALKGRFTPDGSLSNPFLSPVQAQSLAISAGTYYFKSGAMSSAQLLEYQPNYYESRPFCCVFRSPYRSTATTNRIDLNIPMGGLLVQRDALDLRAAVYWSTPITYNTVGGVGNNTADSGYSPRRVILGGSGGHGIFATNQQQCNWGSATGAIGAGWDGGTCGSFPNDLVWGTGRSDTATYENRSGIWSHWITWN